MLWRKGCFRGAGITCQDSSWHQNALPSPSTNTRKLITPPPLPAAGTHPHNLPPASSALQLSWHSMALDYILIFLPISHVLSAQDAPFYTQSFISLGIFHCHTSCNQLEPLSSIPSRPYCGYSHLRPIPGSPSAGPSFPGPSPEVYWKYH